MHIHIPMKSWRPSLKCHLKMNHLLLVCIIYNDIFSMFSMLLEYQRYTVRQSNYKTHLLTNGIRNDFELHDNCIIFY